MGATAAVYRHIPIQIPAKLEPVLEPKRFKILYGGRGSAKSHTVAQILLMMAACQKLRILCVRETQTSIEESSFQLLKDYIEKLKLNGEYYYTKTTIRHRLTGSVFKFIGLREHTATSIKSYEGYDIAWVEEAQDLSERSWKLLIPTIRKEQSKTNQEGLRESEIWATFNPTRATDYVYHRWVKNHDPEALVIKVNWRDNPWFPKVLQKERLRDKAANDPEYDHTWEGKLKAETGILFKRHWFKYYLPHERPKNAPFYGASDYAVTEDPKADYTEHGIFCFDSDNNVFITDWWFGQVEPSKWVDELGRLAAKYEPVMWFEEKGVILRATDASIRRILRKRGIYNMWRVPLASAGTKKERAYGFVAMCSEGMVYLPLNKDGSEPEWVTRLVNLLCAFSGKDGEQDDAVDVCSLLARGSRLMLNAPEEKPEGPPEGYEPVKVGSRAFREARRYQDEDEATEKRKSRYYR